MASLDNPSLNLNNEELREWKIEYSSDIPSDGKVIVTVSCKPSNGGGSSEKVSFSHPGSRIRGVMFNPWLQPDRWERLAQAVHHRSTDIIISTYPKSGTTLVEQATLLFLSNASEEAMHAEEKNALGDRRGDDARFAKVWPEGVLFLDPNSDMAKRGGGEFSPLSIEDFDALPDPRVIKTHAPADMVPGDLDDNTTARYVVVVRNPKDVVTSSFYHPHKENNPCVRGWPFDGWVAAWLGGASANGSWNSWVKGWRLKREKHGSDKVLFITYEDLTSTDDNIRLATFYKLGSFLLFPSKTHQPENSSNDDSLFSSEEEKLQFEGLVQRVDALCSFDTMKKQSKDAYHMRQGKPGNWKEHFSPSLAASFDAATEEEARLCGVYFDQ